ncbi:unnamed protein product, partial [Pylaiella littoralis]
MPVARSTAFVSFDAQQRRSEGINGALTPARPHRTPQQQQQLQQRRHTNSKTLNDIYAATLDKMTTTAPAGQQQGRGRGGGALFGHEPGKLASGEGISLQETETRIVELERSEFDLKLRLFYMGEQLELASGGADVLQLHKETMDAKLQRAQAEEAVRTAREALSEVEVKCGELQTQVRDVKAQRTKDRENWATIQGQDEARLQKHTRLIEDALKTERAENARLRLAADANSRRGSWDGGGQQSRPPPRRKSTGDGACGQVGGHGGTSTGGFGREDRLQQQQQLTAKVRSQDSSLRSLRADVTTLRRRLRTQAETLARQKEETVVVRQAAEQVACVEAEEIARLAVDLERAVQAAHAEAEARRHAEERLAAAETRLWQRKTGGHAQRPASPARSPRGGAGCKILCRGDVDGGREGGRGGRTADFTAEDVFQAPSERNSERESSPLPTPRGALGSTIASRARVVSGGPANRRKEFSTCSKGEGRSSSSPQGGRGAEVVEQRRPWGSSPPPSPRRGRGNGSSLSVTTSRRRPLADAGAASAEQQESPRRHPKDRLPGERRDESSAASRCDHGWRGDVTDKTQLPGTTTTTTTTTTVNRYDRGSRHSHVGEREADTAGERGGSSATRRRGGDNDTTTLTEADATTEARRERKPDGGGGGGGGLATSSVAEAVAAAMSGVDLTETIARVLRAAVATAPVSSSSPGSADVNDRSSGQDTRANDSREQRRGETRLGCYEGRDLLSYMRQGDRNKSAWGSGKPAATVGAPSVDGGRFLKSREVAELESDVQHIFRFFAAKDGRRLS